MVNQDQVSGLLSVVFVVFCFGFVFCRIYFSRTTSFFLSFIKVLIPLVYFCFFRPFYLVDDVQYFNIGKSLAHLDFYRLLLAPFWFTLSHIQMASIIGVSTHWVYYWWNGLLLKIFGAYYFVPVFLNVAMTFVSAYLLTLIVRIALDNNVSKQFLRFVFILFIINWNVIAWSSFLNLKDTVVCMLTLCFVYFAIKLRKEGVRLIWVLNCCIASYLLCAIRFYLPFFVFLSFGVAVMLFAFLKKKFVLQLASIIGATILFLLAIFMFNYFQLSARDSGGGAFVFNYYTLIVGPFRAFISPLPWQVDQSYPFLVLPAVLNLLMFFPSITGIMLYLRKMNEIKLFLFIYFVLILEFYSVFPGESGARQFYQVVWMVVLAQSLFFFEVLKKTLAFKKRIKGSG